jgi:hypothetical protein
LSLLWQSSHDGGYTKVTETIIIRQIATNLPELISRRLRLFSSSSNSFNAGGGFIISQLPAYIGRKKSVEL